MPPSDRLVAYCPTCNATVSPSTSPPTARARAQQHAAITGHVLQLADAATWAPVETVAGEPCLPLWEVQSED